jgi:uncharacterized protein YecT (DUF1311 family)
MKRSDSAAVLLVVALIIGFTTDAVAQEKTEVVYTSPSGSLRVEQSGQTFWVAFTKGESPQRVKLPVEERAPEEEPATPDEFHASPNDEWIFTLRHGGSCLRDGDLFQRVGPEKIDRFNSFNEAAWKNAVKLGAFAHNFSAEGFCAMTEFVSWSFDSARLLIELLGGEDKREMQHRYLYFNTRKQQFELSNYLRKLNKTKSRMLVCAEPVDPLPSQAELKTRFDTLDRRLNTRYAEVLGKTDKERVPNVREAQRNWIKHRDEGASFYVSLFPAAEKERRRLQFLCDVTAARIDTQPDEAWEL